MEIAGIYSFNNGGTVVSDQYGVLLDEIKAIIKSINAKKHKTKESKEKTMPGRLLYSPSALNKMFKNEFEKYGWASVKQRCEYPQQFYTEAYKQKASSVKGAFREMDFVKNRLGVEVQFGKYAFMVYNVCAKMTIFKNLGVIDAGVEIVPMKLLADGMSTGVSYFEQFTWDLEQRGVSDIDIPVLILGIYI